MPDCTNLFHFHSTGAILRLNHVHIGYPIYYFVMIYVFFWSCNGEVGNIDRADEHNQKKFFLLPYKPYSNYSGIFKGNL